MTQSLRNGKKGIAAQSLKGGSKFNFKFSLTIICIFLPALCLAGSKNLKPSSPDGSDAIESTYYSLADFSANFTQETKVELIDRTVSKKGVFKFKKGGRIRIEYEGKDAKTYVSDGTTLWIFVPGDRSSLQTFAVNDETVPKEALSFMGGFGKLKKEFIVTPGNEFKDAPADTLSLHLKPRSNAKHYESLDALFGPDHLVQELIVRNTSGNVSRYKFSDVKTNTNISDNIFTPSSSAGDLLLK